MIILGSTSEVAQAFVEKALTAGEKFPKFIWLLLAEKPQNVLLNIFEISQPSEIIELDLTFKEINYFVFENVD